jgi:hypothetical protein
MTCSSTPAPLTACEVLRQAMNAVHENVLGNSVSEIRLRDRSTRFSESTGATRLRYLQSLVTNKAVYGRCPEFALAASIAGVPVSRAPGVAVYGRTFFDQGCGCGPVVSVCESTTSVTTDDGTCCE